MTMHMGGQSTVFRSQFSPSTACVPGIELSLSIGGKCLYPLSSLSPWSGQRYLTIFVVKSSHKEQKTCDVQLGWVSEWL